MLDCKSKFRIIFKYINYAIQLWVLIHQKNNLCNYVWIFFYLQFIQKTALLASIDAEI